MLSFFVLAVFMVAVLAGGIASVSGFGIGSLLTPLFALRLELKLAVAAVSIPHFVATALRCWLLRQHIDRGVFISFGIASAAGGLLGALFHTAVKSPILMYVFGALLIYAGFSAMSGLSSVIRVPKSLGWLAGLISGAFGGLVGNQGGIRSAALISYDLDKQAFVATATAIGLIVDLVRMPVYFYTQWSELQKVMPLIALATIGTVVGTLSGKFVLGKIPENTYRAVLGATIFALGIYELFAPQ
jgi:uncharacterized membrane protein YfcA